MTERSPGPDEDGEADRETSGFEPDGGVRDAAPAEDTGDGPPTPGPAVPTDDVGEVEPVEVLVSLAEEGEIEPWDIDIVAVTDAFLARLDEADLRTSGRALFYASVLLRMKSDALLEDRAAEETEPEPDPWSPFGGPGGGSMAGGDPAGEGGAAGAEGPPPGYDPVEALESEMERRLDRKSARGTPETLEGLVRELRSAERERRWKESRSYDTSESPHGFQRGTQTVDYRADDDARVAGEPTAEDVTGTTHAEEMSETVDAVREALVERWDRGRDAVLFAEVATAGGSRVLTYLALLFLAHDGECDLQQDELFGDLWIADVAGGRASR
ncbi:MAG: segregation/condensation protein A [Halobacteriaceae archaeon]